MSSKLLDLEKEISKIRSSIEDSAKIKKILEQNKADLQHYTKVAQQNIKYLKKKNITAAIGEYEKVISAYKEAIKKINQFETEIRMVEASIEKLAKKLTQQTVTLEKLRKASEPKVLPFKRKHRE